VINDAPRPSPRAPSSRTTPAATSRPLPIPTKVASSLSLDAAALPPQSTNEAIQNHVTAFVAQLQLLTTEALNGTISKMEQVHAAEMQKERARTQEIQAQLTDLQNSHASTCKGRDELQQNYESVCAERDELRAANSRLEKDRSSASVTNPSREGNSTPREGSISDLNAGDSELSFAHRRLLFEQAARKRTGI